MSRWDKYRVEEDTKPLNKWDKYKVTPVAPIVPEKEGDSWPALIGKSALKGFSSIADLPALSAKATEKIINLGRKTSGNPSEVYWAAQNPNITNVPKITNDENIPETNYSDYVPAGESVKSGIKNYTGVDLEPNPSSPAQRIVAQGADFGASMLPWNWKTKGQNLFNQFKNAAKASKGATAVGLGSGALQESGVNPFAADVISSVATPNLKVPSFKDVIQSPKKTTMKVMGLGPQRLNIKAAQAANDLGIELPAAVLTDSTLTGLADQAISKTPFFGNKLKNKYDNAQSKLHGKLGEVYNEIGPQRTPEIEKEIFDLYEKRKAELPKGVTVKPLKTKAALDKIEIDTAVLSDEEKELSRLLERLKRELSPSLNSQFGNVKIPAQDFRVKRLIGTKQSLNKIIKWDIPEGVKEQLRNVQHSISEDIAEYGKTNPQWYKNYKEADDLFSKVAKREKVEDLLRNEGLNDPEDISYAMLSRSISDKKKNKLIRKNVPKETYKKIEKLGILSNAMVRKNRRTPNPSGTAPTAAALGFLSGVFFDPTGVFTPATIAGVGGAAVTTKLLTDKKFLDLALHYAETEGKGKISTAMKLNKRAKDITGYTLNSIYRASKNLNKEEEQDELQ